MSEAPNRIWAWVYADPWGNELRWFEWQDHKPDAGDTEYIRADLVEAAVKRAIEACAQEVKAKAKPHVRERLKMRLAKRGYRMRDPILARAYLRAANNIRALASDPEAIAKIVEGK
jgi:hypothetical protein